MQPVKHLLANESQNEILFYLKHVFLNKVVLSEMDVKILKDYETTNYALIGLIGLLVNCKARILLGKKQDYQPDIQNWCNDIETTHSDLMHIADKYLDDNFEEEPEFILRKVMLEYTNEQAK